LVCGKETRDESKRIYDERERGGIVLSLDLVLVLVRKREEGGEKEREVG
jgi:hypothetical protein